jgi:hypothetical protein
MSRKNRIRWPFAETSMFSLMFAVEIEGVRAVLALDGVAAVARVPLERVVVLAQQCEVAPQVAVDEVVAGAADTGSPRRCRRAACRCPATVDRDRLVRERAVRLVDAEQDFEPSARIR